MMMNTRKKHLAVAVAGAVSLGASIAHAADFNATATLQNTLAVTSLQDFDLGSVIATVTANALTQGVAALVVSPSGAASEPLTPGDSGSVNMTSLIAPTAAQGSVDMAAAFTLTLPDTSTVDAADFPASVATDTVTEYGTAIELVHESANPIVPSLFLVHFDIDDVSGGTSVVLGTANAGTFTITPEFAATTYIFNIGATITTEPYAFDGTAGNYPKTYQEGTYAGTFPVTASY